MAKEQLVVEVVAGTYSKDHEKQLTVKQLNKTIKEEGWEIEFSPAQIDDGLFVAVLKREVGVTLG
jgi:hypothetical protein